MLAHCLSAQCPNAWFSAFGTPIQFIKVYWRSVWKIHFLHHYAHRSRTPCYLFGLGFCHQKQKLTTARLARIGKFCCGQFYYPTHQAHRITRTTICCRTSTIYRAYFRRRHQLFVPIGARHHGLQCRYNSHLALSQMVRSGSCLCLGQCRGVFTHELGTSLSKRCLGGSSNGSRKCMADVQNPAKMAESKSKIALRFAFF